MYNKLIFVFLMLTNVIVIQSQSQSNHVGNIDSCTLEYYFTGDDNSYRRQEYYQFRTDMRGSNTGYREIFVVDSILDTSNRAIATTCSRQLYNYMDQYLYIEDSGGGKMISSLPTTLFENPCFAYMDGNEHSRNLGSTGPYASYEVTEVTSSTQTTLMLPAVNILPVLGVALPQPSLSPVLIYPQTNMEENRFEFAIPLSQLDQSIMTILDASSFPTEAQLADLGLFYDNALGDEWKLVEKQILTFAVGPILGVRLNYESNAGDRLDMIFEVYNKNGVESLVGSIDIDLANPDSPISSGAMVAMGSSVTPGLSRSEATVFGVPDLTWPVLSREQRGGPEAFEIIVREDINAYHVLEYWNTGNAYEVNYSSVLPKCDESVFLPSWIP